MEHVIHRTCSVLSSGRWNISERHVSLWEVFCIEHISVGIASLFLLWGGVGSWVLQCVAVCCSVLHCVAVCCIVLQYVFGQKGQIRISNIHGGAVSNLNTCRIYS